jgi:hypothetical protein
MLKINVAIKLFIYVVYDGIKGKQPLGSFKLFKQSINSSVFTGNICFECVDTLKYFKERWNGYKTFPETSIHRTDVKGSPYIGNLWERRTVCRQLNVA